MARDPKDESQRLAELYGGMTEGELKKLASDAGSLTDAAVNALKTELSNRRSKFGLEYPQTSADNVPHPKLVTLRQFRDLPAALLAKSVLDSAGIECFLADENTIRMDWLWSNLLGGIKPVSYTHLLWRSAILRAGCPRQCTTQLEAGLRTCVRCRCSTARTSAVRVHHGCHHERNQTAVSELSGCRSLLRPGT